MRFAKGFLGSAVCASALWSGAVIATETGGSSYPQGPEGYTGAALPPPGDYMLIYLEHYTADRFNDGNGNAGFLPDFDVNATAAILRYVRVDKATVLGASIAHAAIVPVVDLDVNIAGNHDSRTGLADITLTPLILGWHFKNDIHVVAALDINAPTGAYDRSRMANIGRNYWNFEPILTFAYYPKGGFSIDIKAMYDFNLTNKKAQINALNPTGADYKSGQEFHVDFAVGQQIGKVKAGVSGYFYRQTTSDKVDHAATQLFLDSLGGFKGKAFALGPSLQVNAGKAMLIGTWQHEFQADYRPQGEKFWLKAIIPLS